MTESENRGATALPSDLFRDPACSTSARPVTVGGKWTALVLRCLEDNRPHRFTELRVPLHWITPKVLTETLRAMERDGFVSRTVHDEHPPRVEYALTPLGRSLLDPLDAACAWARTHGGAIAEARDSYDTAAETR
ncbi:winged helix-turn-helix transcriptional regulator [Streptomyces laurentii]|uniref:winged helix-turn-helix transcriptional regulator n=1 Tax=Streptomyces laurentii TaxID=39478 RepID=UPI0036856DBF